MFFNRTREPQEALHKRIRFCLDVHAEAIRVRAPRAARRRRVPGCATARVVCAHRPLPVCSLSCSLAPSPPSHLSLSLSLSLSLARPPFAAQAMRYPPRALKEDLLSAEERAAREKEESEWAKEIEEGGDDDEDGGGGFDD